MTSSRLKDRLQTAVDRITPVKLVLFRIVVWQVVWSVVFNELRNPAREKARKPYLVPRVSHLTA